MMGDCHMIQDLYFTMWMAINPQNPQKIFENSLYIFLKIYVFIYVAP